MLHNQQNNHPSSACQVFLIFFFSMDMTINVLSWCRQKQTVKPEGQRAVNGEVAGESTAPRSLHREIKSTWGRARWVPGCWGMLFTALLNYYQPQRCTHLKFDWRKFRNREHQLGVLVLFSLWAEFFMAVKPFVKPACGKSLCWNANSLNGRHVMGCGDWVWWLSPPVIQKSGDDPMVRASTQDVGSVPGCWCSLQLVVLLQVLMKGLKI